MKYKLSYRLSWRNDLGELADNKPQPPICFRAENDDQARDKARNHVDKIKREFQKDAHRWRFGVPKFVKIKLERVITPVKSIPHGMRVSNRKTF